MTDRPFDVLFLCTGNSARSILAEALANHWGRGRIVSHSAGSAPKLDFVITVCDNAAAETCPLWPGQPMTAHWGVADPAAVEGSETDRWLAFRQTFRELESRIKAFTSLPIHSLDRSRLHERLRDIGQNHLADEVA